MANDIKLAPGQKLEETWTIRFEGRERRGEKPFRFVTGTILRWYNGTYYGGSTGEGETVDEARLAMVLGLARAICNDESAFNHDAEELGNWAQLHWFQAKIKELQEERDSEDLTSKAAKRLDRKINFLELLMAEWQEDSDFWPDDEEDRTTYDRLKAEATRQADRRAALSTLRAADAAHEQRTGASED